MKIVWVSHSGMFLGGAEICLVEAIKGLHAKGIEVQVVLPERGSLVGVFEDVGVNVHVIPYIRWVKPAPIEGLRDRIERLRQHRRKNIPAAKALVRLLRVIKPDLVVTNTVTIPVGAIAAKWVKIPHVWYIHELFGKESHDIHLDFGRYLSMYLIRWLSKRIIVNSRSVMSIYSKYLPVAKLRCVYCATEVPSQIENRKSNREFKLVQVGMLSVGKRQEDAIRSLSLLAQRGLDVRLSLVGSESPKYGAFLRGLARDLGIDKIVDFIPFTRNPFEHVAASDVALTCSRGEAFGRTTIEAMKLGKPVVGAKSVGTAELIKDAWNGFLYPLGNVEELSRKIEALYHDRNLSRSIGETARVWAERTFTIENYASGLLEVFREAILLGSR
jgi:glycosyltransferase involved in cell wall biosynthesis